MWMSPTCNWWSILWSNTSGNPQLEARRRPGASGYFGVKQHRTRYQAAIRKKVVPRLWGLLPNWVDQHPPLINSFCDMWVVLELDSFNNMCMALLSGWCNTTSLLSEGDYHWYDKYAVDDMHCTSKVNGYTCHNMSIPLFVIVEDTILCLCSIMLKYQIMMGVMIIISVILVNLLMINVWIIMMWC